MNPAVAALRVRVNDVLILESLHIIPSDRRGEEWSVCDGPATPLITLQMGHISSAPDNFPKLRQVICCHNTQSFIHNVPELWTVTGTCYQDMNIQHDTLTQGHTRHRDTRDTLTHVTVT